jgi:hypothetical protein
MWAKTARIPAPGGSTDKRRRLLFSLSLSIALPCILLEQSSGARQKRWRRHEINGLTAAVWTEEAGRVGRSQLISFMLRVWRHGLASRIYHMILVVCRSHLLTMVLGCQSGVMRLAGYGVSGYEARSLAYSREYACTQPTLK